MRKLKLETKQKPQENAWKLVSPSQFLELFAEKRGLSPETAGFFLPETVIFQENAPKLWFFHSKRLKTRELLHKSAKTLSFTAICQRFLEVSDEEALKLAETAHDSQKTAAFVRLAGKKPGNTVSRPELARILLQKRASLVLLQEIIATNSKKPETFVCEMRRNATNPWVFRVFKEFSATGREKTAVKSLDSRTNARVCEALQRICEVFAGIGVKVLQICGKFLFDFEERLVFLGLRSVFLQECEAWRDLVEGDCVSFAEVLEKGCRKAEFPQNLR